MRALAEAPQLLLEYSGLEYEYLMSWDHFEDVWPNVKSKIPFQQLPMMEAEDGTQICQSIAILQYIENRSGLAINDPVKAAEAMAILQSSQELFAPLNPTINFATGDDFIAKRDTMRGGLNNRFADLSRCLENYEVKFFIDDIPRAAEFAAFHHMDLSRHLDPDILNSFPRLVQFVKDIESIKTVSSYLENRPELIDVGVEPKLIIDGRPQPTGVQKT